MSTREQYLDSLPLVQQLKNIANGRSESTASIAAKRLELLDKILEVAEIQITNGYTNSCNSLIDKINQQSKCKLDAIKHIERAIMLLESDVAPFHALNAAINVLK